MFSRFTKRSGKAIFIRSASISTIEDTDTGSAVMWIESDGMHAIDIRGTADENMERLKQDELAAIAEAQRLEQRRANNLPIVPVPRGRP